VETDAKKFSDFLQSLVRFCLYTGSTSTVKFEIYRIIKQISSQDFIDSYRRDEISTETFSHLGRLKSSFALLAYYIDTNEPIPAKYSIDKIVNLRDEDFLGEDWKYDNLSDICNSIGNLVVLDIPKRYNSVKDKYEQYKTSKSDYVRRIFSSEYFSYSDWRGRNVHMQNLLVKFFSKIEQ
jgi:rRNA maturation protein Nop10